MSAKASYSRIQNRDSLIVDPPARTLRKKVSRAFGNLARRASSASLREHRAKQEQQEQEQHHLQQRREQARGQEGMGMDARAAALSLR